MRRFFKIILSLLLIVVLYFYIISPAIIAYRNEDNIFVSILNNVGIEIEEEEALDFNGNSDFEDSDKTDSEKFTNKSSSGNDERFQSICSFDENGYVWCTQNKQLLGFSSGCLLTSYSMLIINAGRYVGTEKNYDPVDVYLGNNYMNSGIGDTTNPSNRVISAWHYVIATSFNYTWNKYNVSSMNNSDKIEKLKNTLKDNPWGVVIGGSYTKSSGGTSTHYIVARLDSNDNIVFDDPAYTSRLKGAKIGDISNVWGINSWSNISSIMTIKPNLDSNGVWQPGTWEKCLNSSTCDVCYKCQNCKQ